MRFRRGQFMYLPQVGEKHFLQFTSEKHFRTDSARTSGELLGTSSINKVRYTFPTMFLRHRFEKVTVGDRQNGRGSIYHYFPVLVLFSSSFGRSSVNQTSAIIKRK